MTTGEREILRGRLLALGFDVVRFASAEATPAGGFADWLDAGNHADMAWLPRTAEKRLDAGRVLEGVRSVIALGVNHLPDGDAAAQSRWGKYSVYSDYHDTIGRAVRAAGAVLEEVCGLGPGDHRGYVDTGPVLERGWAARAGLGWQGKNAMLLSRTHGNWLLLSAILTRLAIPPDEPLPAVARTPDRVVGHHCGACTRCLDACPTAAFPRPGWVDARRCIAYHTIENRGMIPRELRPAFGGRVFGCDTCLDVCPWNRFARAGRSALLEARPAIVGLTLLDLLEMDAAGFRARFRGTPIERSRLAGLLRNACVVAGNWHESADWRFGGVTEAALARALTGLCVHASPIVRAHAVWALHRLVGAGEARRRTVDVRAAETDAGVLAEYDAWA